MILMTGEFSFVIGNWTGQFDELITSDLYNLIPNPDKNDEADPDSSTISKASARVSSGFQTRESIIVFDRLET